MVETLNNKILEMLKAYALAVPFNDDVGFAALRPYPLHQGNFVMVEHGEAPIHLTRENYEENVMKLYDKIVAHAKEMPNPLSTLFICMSSPYRIQFLHLIKNYITKKELSDQFEWIWVQTEFPHSYPIKMLIDLFKASDRNVLMNEEEQRRYDRLPDEVVIYRGTQTKKAKVRGLSWTLSKEKAIWFATRWQNKSPLYSAKIKKKYIFAVFLGRGEEEIVVNPRYLIDLEEVSFEYTKKEVKSDT